jgi:nitrogen fixation NifU-like protein
MDSIYRDYIIDHYQNPLHRCELKDATLSERDANPLCGDDLTVQLRISEEGVVEKCAFSGKGCSISQAAADILCEEIEGKRIADVVEMTKEEMLELLGIPLGPVRVKCGLLAFKIVKVALLKYVGTGGGSGEEIQSL